MKRPSLAALIGMAGLLAAPVVQALDLDTGTIPSPRFYEPAGEVEATVFLLSDADGWNAAEEAEANALKAAGALTVGIDLPAYLARLDAERRDCAYAVSSIESLSRQLQRRAGLKTYHPPIIAGERAGGALALAIAAQTPVATIGGTAALDPDAEIALAKPFCTPASKVRTANGMRYGLKVGPLPNPIDILRSPAISADGRTHSDQLKAQHPDIGVTDIDKPDGAALVRAIRDRIDAQHAALEALPLTEVPAASRQDLLAIIISGDGGWRDIDRKVAAYLAEDGVPTVGLDALRYFWTERTPEETARDLERIIDAYAPRYGTGEILLIGYSFGANVLPSAFLQMGPEYRQKTVMLSLLAPSRRADFEIAVSGWLGVEGSGKAGLTADHVRAGDPGKVQCIYGLAEEESACHDLAGSAVEMRPVKGGHHFDGDYRALAQLVLRSAIARRHTASTLSSGTAGN